MVICLSIVAGDCPPLFSRFCMSDLGVHVKCNSDSITSRKLDIEDVPVVLASDGHYLLDIREFRDAPKVRELWKAGVVPKIELESCCS